MKSFEVNGNLEDEKNFNIFLDSIVKTKEVFNNTFGLDVMSKIDLYVDNAIEMSGYTPKTTVILKKYIIIKLGIKDFSRVEQTIYQFAHELCHYVFYSIKGLDKTKADSEEENICSAMSLILINILCPDKIDGWVTYVNNLSNENYNKGGKIAMDCNFDINILKDKIYKLCDKGCMMEKIDIKDYEEKIKEEKYEDIYMDLVNKSIAAVKELGKRKGYKIPEDKEEKDLFHRIQVYFEENFIHHLSLKVYYLMNSLIEWNQKNEEVYYTYERKIDSIIMRYNDFIDEIKEYEEIANEINRKGIDIVTKEREEKYRKQFKERFEHSKKYDETWDVVKLIKKIIQTEKKDCLKSNNVEKIMLIDNAYNYILKIGYQKVSYIYSDEYLKTNQ